MKNLVMTSARFGLTAVLVFFATHAHSQDRASSKLESDKPRSIEERQKEFKKKSPQELGDLLDKDAEQVGVINRLRVLGDKSSRAPLERAYAKAKTRDAKLAAATALVSLGKKDGEEWVVVNGAAQAALNEESPYPMKVDEKDSIVPKTYSEEFLAWCAKRGEKPDIAADRALHAEPREFSFIGYTRDPRAIPVLLEGLKSKNHQLVVIAAQELARLQYKPAVLLIIDAARRLPKGMDLGLGYALACFDDPKAQAAFPQYIRNEKAVEELRQRFHDGNCLLLVGE